MSWKLLPLWRCLAFPAARGGAPGGPADRTGEVGLDETTADVVYQGALAAA